MVELVLEQEVVVEEQQLGYCFIITAAVVELAQLSLG